MKRLTYLLVLSVALAGLMAACGGKKKVQVPEEVIVPTDTIDSGYRL